MTDFAQTIEPKSDQLNADDLIAGPITIAITSVSVVGGDQPAAIHFEGDNGKPYKPCKTMRRLLVMLWGADSKAFTGRRLTLFREPTVRFGRDEVGGIRISHMSHIPGPRTVPLTVTRGSRKPYTVQPLAAARDAPFVFTLVNSAGRSGQTEDGEHWANTLSAWFASGKIDDAKAAALWAANKEHVEAAECAGHALLAQRIWIAAAKRGVTQVEGADECAADVSKSVTSRGAAGGHESAPSYLSEPGGEP